MKTSALITMAMSLLGLSLAPTLAAKAPQQQAKIREGGYTFKVSRYDDDRARPYRVFFWDDHLTGSSYRLDVDGHVRYFKAGAEVYYDRAEKGDHLLTFKRKREGPRRMTPDGKGPRGDDEDLPGLNCDECSAALEAVCDSGLPAFCKGVKKSTLGHDGKKSVDILCDNQENACAKAKAACEGTCAAEEAGHASTCSNGVVGVESSNGKACCVAECGVCGGVGCSVFGAAFGLDAHDCCATEIADDGPACSKTKEAPCAIDDVVTHDDGISLCSDGTVGVESSNGKACCVSECGKCGGVGCSDFGKAFGLDNHDCCASEIADEGAPCSKLGVAPCYLDDAVTEEPDDGISRCSDGTVGVESSNGKACCVSECGACGGEGCSDFGAAFGLDNHDCCATEIADEGAPCSKLGVAPCYLDDMITEVVDETPTEEPEQEKEEEESGKEQPECSRESLSDAAQEQLDTYDNDMSLDEKCVDDTATSLVVGCNYMGLGQECRGCYMTCDGAMKYMEKYPEQIEAWGSDAIINFCDGAEATTLEDCM